MVTTTGFCNHTDWDLTDLENQVVLFHQLLQIGGTNLAPPI